MLQNSYPTMTPDEYKTFQKELLSGRKTGRVAGYVNLKIQVGEEEKLVLTRFEFHI